tara:strand:+ start:778 stop:1527 length:750 start_codon:yes stop_codon:yes gene_type:complete
MANKEKALAKTGETGYAIVDSPDAHEVMIGAFDQLGVSDFQLGRIKIPAGGGMAWEVESLEGTEVHQSLDVLILAIKGNQKSWWSSSMEEGGGGTPPSCSSKDGVFGFGVNTLDAAPDAAPTKNRCSECAWNQFGSAGAGKACKDHSLLFFFREGSRLPSLLTVPATSQKALQGYILKLIDAGKRAEGCVTRLSLKKAQSQSGITYSTLDLSWVSDLDDEAKAKMVEVSKDFRDRISDFDAFASNDDAN